MLKNNSNNKNPLIDLKKEKAITEEQGTGDSVKNDHRREFVERIEKVSDQENQAQINKKDKIGDLDENWKLRQEVLRLKHRLEDIEIKEKKKPIMSRVTARLDLRKNNTTPETVPEEPVIKEALKPLPRKKRLLEFPDNFLWGTSTSAYQVEGGNVNDWSVWEKSKARIDYLKKNNLNPKDYISGQACDSYNRYEEDFDLAKSLNNNAVRFGIEWSRIEPEKDTCNVTVINHYRDVLSAAKKRGLKTFVTLWHWTNPVWFAKEGGWAGKEALTYFNKYVELVIKELGADIDYWITLNEPTVHVANGYLNGKFPPNKRNIFLADRVIRKLARAHNEAYDLIHNYFPNAQVSITKLRNYIEPAHKWLPIEVAYANMFNYFANKLFFKKIKNNFDYVGLDYYFHDRIVWYPPFIKNKNKQVTDMGWEIYPEGIYHVLKYLSRFNKPILITENGVADESGGVRSQFIKDHLYYVHKAIKEGIDVRGYFYWSLLDNFEWAHGYGPKFGLFKVDRKTFARTARPSAEVYRKICKENAVEV